MRSISNTDYDTAIALLTAFSLSHGASVRERNDRRRAGLLARKLERRKAQCETSEQESSGAE